MTNKLCCNLVLRLRATKPKHLLLSCILLLCVGAYAPQARAGGDAPAWMHALAGVPLPAHDEKTDAVLLYSEKNVTAISADKLILQVRQAYKVLRPGGREFGYVGVTFNPTRKITSLHGWCIPAQGRDFEVKDKDSVDVALSKVEGSELVTDVRERILHIPAAGPGSIVGYEYVVEVHPMVLEDVWDLQEQSPLRESRYSLQLPAGWEYKATWLNHDEVKPIESGNNHWQWTLTDVKGIRLEENMPPLRGVAAHMIVTLFPPGATVDRSFRNWREMGIWYTSLTSGRRDASPELKKNVVALTASANTPLAKMKALAQFVQTDIRYVAIELGIGGWQPHPAPDVFVHRYGDCKDKATLMSSMLHEIGIESYYVVINSDRGTVTPKAPANVDGFNHVILAIQLPAALNDASLIAVIEHPKLGRLLYFDPTNEMTPFGQIGGYLQSNYGLLVTATGGELVLLPRQPAAMNGIERTAKLSLDATGKLTGEVKEVRVGDRASSERWQLRSVSSETERIKPVETLLADSLSHSHITHASMTNLKNIDQPFTFDFGLEAENYAKSAGDLLLVRPRILGRKSSGMLETKEQRVFAIEFPAPLRDTDTFDINLPAGFEVDDLPLPVDAEYSFASYHSKSEVSGNVIRYTRSFEQKELTVPAAKSEELKKFYRTIAADERNTAVLKPVAK